MVHTLQIVEGVQILREMVASYNRGLGAEDAHSIYFCRLARRCGFDAEQFQNRLRDDNGAVTKPDIVLYVKGTLSLLGMISLKRAGLSLAVLLKDMRKYEKLNPAGTNFTTFVYGEEVVQFATWDKKTEKLTLLEDQAPALMNLLCKMARQIPLPTGLTLAILGARWLRDVSSAIHDHGDDGSRFGTDLRTLRQQIARQSPQVDFGLACGELLFLGMVTDWLFPRDPVRFKELGWYHRLVSDIRATATLEQQLGRASVVTSLWRDVQKFQAAFDKADRQPFLRLGLANIDAFIVQFVRTFKQSETDSYGWDHERPDDENLAQFSVLQADAHMRQDSDHVPTFLDPCCGYGNFLVARIRAWRDQFGEDDFRRRVHEGLLTSSLGGVEYNLRLYIMAQLRVKVELHTLGVDTMQVHVPIYHGDAFALHARQSSVFALFGEDHSDLGEFGAILEAEVERRDKFLGGRIDAIVMHPPPVGQNQPEGIDQGYEEQGTVYYQFLALAKRWVARPGVIVAWFPSTWIDAKGNKGTIANIRRRFLDERWSLAVVDCGGRRNKVTEEEPLNRLSGGLSITTFSWDDAALPTRLMTSLSGDRENKKRELLAPRWRKIAPQAPNYEFVPLTDVEGDHNEAFFRMKCVTSAFYKSGRAVTTSRDGEVLLRDARFHGLFHTIQVRPFDVQRLDWNEPGLTRGYAGKHGPNPKGELLLLLARGKQPDSEWCVGVSRANLVLTNAVSTKGSGYVFPCSELRSDFVTQFPSESREDVFHFLVALFSDPEYQRAFHRAMLQSLPHLPNLEGFYRAHFHTYLQIGRELSRLFLLDGVNPENLPKVDASQKGHVMEVVHPKVHPADGRWYITESLYFEVEDDVLYAKVGGCQPLRRFWMTRRNESLTQTDIETWARAYTATKALLRLLKQYDALPPRPWQV